MNYPKIVKIIETKKETSNVKTLTFQYPQKTKPGQFFMVWIPNIDEIPMSASYIDKNIKGITFRNIGQATNALFKLKKDDKIGIRGPYGNGFQINGKKILFIGGGTGIATLSPAIEQAGEKNISTDVILGVKNKNELFFERRIKQNGAKVYITTDDGTKGTKGYASDLARQYIRTKKYDSIITCGPEKMMKKILDINQNIPFQASLERYMKCCIGICGQCCIDNGLRVCEEGPVFDGKTLKKVKEFGIYKRDASGKKVRL